jgi:hypothetical protein
MKKIVIALMAGMLVTGTAFAADKAPETKKVCHEKNGKQVCKVIKVHKKAETVTTGSPADPAKKKKK